MTRLIDADALVEELHKHFGIGFDDDEWWNSTHVLTAIAWTSTVDAVQVRHGKWEWKKYANGYETWECSVCRSPMITRFWYCPNCGAKMDGEHEID